MTDDPQTETGLFALMITDELAEVADLVRCAHMATHAIPEQESADALRGVPDLALSKITVARDGADRIRTHAH